MSTFYIFFVAFAAAFVAMPLNIYASKKFGLVDVPKDKRRMHDKPVPTMGGITIFIVVIIVALIFIPHSKRLFSLLLGGVVIAVSGMIDDVKNLRPIYKLIAQIIAAIIAVSGGLKIQFISNPFVSNEIIDLKLFGTILTIIWIVGVTNALNFVDGMDGLCAGLASISAITFYIASDRGGFAPLLALAIAGAALGFLPYNFNPAKIFMGDTGALFLGYTLACISIEGVVKSVATISLILPIFILALPVFDTLFAMIRRKLNGQKIMSADKGHLHHRLVQKGFTVKQTVLILYAIAIVFSVLGILIGRVEPSLQLTLSLICLVAVITLAGFFGLFKKNGQDTQQGGIH